MINLLPLQTRKIINAARLNTILRRYILFFSASALFMIGIFGAGFYLTTMEKEAAQKELLSLQETASKYTATQKEAEEFSSNLSTAKTILSNEITFSDLILGIASSVPSGSVLTGLNVSTESLGEEMVLNARTRNEEGGLLLKSALESSPVFEKVNIQSITNPPPASENTTGNQDPLSRDYPYLVTINATLSSKSPTPAAPQGANL